MVEMKSPATAPDSSKVLPTAKATKSTSRLSAAQLARKRANDRLSQRVIRARNKDLINSLRQEIQELRSRDYSGVARELFLRNIALQSELRRLRQSIGLPPGNPESLRISPTASGMMSSRTEANFAAPVPFQNGRERAHLPPQTLRQDARRRLNATTANTSEIPDVPLNMEAPYAATHASTPNPGLVPESYMALPNAPDPVDIPNVPLDMEAPCPATYIYTPNPGLVLEPYMALPNAPASADVPNVPLDMEAPYPALHASAPDPRLVPEPYMTLPNAPAQAQTLNMPLGIEAPYPATHASAHDPRLLPEPNMARASAPDAIRNPDLQPDYYQECLRLSTNAMNDLNFMCSLYGSSSV